MHSTYNDSREVISDFESAESDREAYTEALSVFEGEISDDAKEMLMRFTDWSTDEEDTYQQLKDACETGEREVSDWANGAELILAADFDEDYAEQLCKKLGYIASDFPGWIEIDWKTTAENMQQDYTTVTLMGADYLVRA